MTSDSFHIAHYPNDLRELSYFYQALELISNVRKAFEDLLSEVPWMDEATRKVAHDKVSAMKL